GSHWRGVVVAWGSQSSAVDQLAGLCHSTENDAPVLESVKPTVVVQWRRNTGHASLVRPRDIRLVNLTLAARTNSHHASRVAGVALGGPIRVASFSRRLQNNVRCGQKQQTVANDRRTLSARRQSPDPPALRSIRKVVCHQTLARLKVASQHDNLVGPVVTPMH